LAALIAARHWLERVDPHGDGFEQVRQEGLQHCDEGLCRDADQHQGRQGGYGWDRTMIDTTEGARIWTGHGVLAHNLIKISALAG
jgi:hypothetical protein